MDFNTSNHITASGGLFQYQEIGVMGRFVAQRQINHFHPFIAEELKIQTNPNCKFYFS